jgi:hypothetical protein
MCVSVEHMKYTMADLFGMCSLYVHIRYFYFNTQKDKHHDVMAWGASPGKKPSW